MVDYDGEAEDFTDDETTSDYDDDYYYSYYTDEERLDANEAQAVDTVVGSTSGAVGRSVSILAAAAGAGTTCFIVSMVTLLDSVCSFL